MSKNINGLYKEGNLWRVKKQYKRVKISFTKSSQQEALFELKYRMKEIDDKIKLGICLDKEIRKKTLQDVFDEFVKEKGTRWKENTKRYNMLLFKNHFTTISTTRVDSLKDDDISKWIQKIKQINKAKDGRELSNLPYRLAGLLKEVLEFAIRKKYCSPLLDLSFMNTIAKINTVSQRTENNYINYNEFKLLCEAVQKIPESQNGQRNTDMLFLIKFLYYTGVRIGEARAIKKSDIIKELIRTQNETKYNCYVYVYKQFGDNNYILDNTLKGNNPKRKVRIKQEVYEEFMKYLESNNYQDDDYIFDFHKNNKPLYRSVISNNLKRIIKLAKKLGYLPETFADTLSPHGFRYSNTIYLKNILNLSIELAAANQGHTVSVMLNIYTRIDKSEEISIFSFK